MQFLLPSIIFPMDESKEDIHAIALCGGGKESEKAWLNLHVSCFSWLPASHRIAYHGAVRCLHFASFPPHDDWIGSNDRIKSNDWWIVTFRCPTSHFPSEINKHDLTFGDGSGLDGGGRRRRRVSQCGP